MMSFIASLQNCFVKFNQIDCNIAINNTNKELCEICLLIVGPKESNFFLQWSPRVLKTGIDVIVDFNLTIG